ncbi:MAG: hypothetical protein JOZ39_07255 [Chloroflexi bacterium]|nr:hypothetical protein [Chloroflexota bacterium]
MAANTAATAKLAIGLTRSDRVSALVDGSVRAEGVDLDITIGRPARLFPAMLQGDEFAGSEWSFAWYAIRHAQGKRDLIALPVF